MAERLKAHAWKACKGLRPSQVRILSLPPGSNKIPYTSTVFLLLFFRKVQDSSLRFVIEHSEITASCRFHHAKTAPNGAVLSMFAMIGLQSPSANSLSCIARTGTQKPAHTVA